MDENLIKRWADSPSVAEQVAADFAKKIYNGQLTRWAELPANDETADDYGVSTRTVIRAKKLLADESGGTIWKLGGVYVVA
jgi:DNA-binding GntR family transcriptional regulator